MSLELDIFESPDAELCKQYWEIGSDGEFCHSVKQISANHDISSSKLLKKVRSNCHAYSTTIFCNSCSEPYVYKSRSDYQRLQSRNAFITCDNCLRDIKQDEELNKINAIQSFIDSIDFKLSIDNLSVRQAVFLYALIRHSANENLTGLDEFGLAKTELFSPDKDYNYHILKELHDQRIILISPGSNLDHITLLDNGGVQYYIERVKWILPLKETYKNMNQFINELDYVITSLNYIDKAYDDVVELCKEVNLNECIGYLQHTLYEHQLNFNPGKKTILVLSKALEQYSVAQVYNLIWAAVNNAAAYFMRSHVSKKQAANSVVGNIERRIEKSEANNWELKPFRRLFDLPQSQISRVLFNLLLHTDDGGFNLCSQDYI